MTVLAAAAAYLAAATVQLSFALNLYAFLAPSARHPRQREDERARERTSSPFFPSPLPPLYFDLPALGPTMAREGESEDGQCVTSKERREGNGLRRRPQRRPACLPAASARPLFARDTYYVFVWPPPKHAPRKRRRVL